MEIRRNRLRSRTVFQDDSRVRLTWYIRCVSTLPKLEMHCVGQSYLLILSLLLLLLPG